MSTAEELLQMFVALRKTAELYVNVTADGKVDVQDLNAENIQGLIDLSQSVVEAIKIENGFDLKTLDKTVARDLIAHGVESIFMFLKLKPTGENPATYKDLREIVDLLQQLVELFEKMAADGEITWTDAVANLGSLIDITKAVQLAAKIDGQIAFSELTPEQAAELVADIVEAVYSVIAAAKKLQVAS